MPPARLTPYVVPSRSECILPAAVGLIEAIIRELSKIPIPRHYEAALELYFKSPTFWTSNSPLPSPVAQSRTRAVPRPNWCMTRIRTVCLADHRWHNGHRTSNGQALCSGRGKAYSHGEESGDPCSG